MITKLEKIKKKLEAKGINPTLIRVKILEYMDGNKSHPDADTVYRDLKDELPVLSRTSVYNTLNLFNDKNLIIKLTAAPGRVNFDSNPQGHFHFICDNCEKVYDVDLMNSVLKKKSVDNHSIREVHGYFKGTCKECRERSR